MVACSVCKCSIVSMRATLCNLDKCWLSICVMQLVSTRFAAQIDVTPGSSHQHAQCRRACCAFACDHDHSNGAIIVMEQTTTAVLTGTAYTGTNSLQYSPPPPKTRTPSMSQQYCQYYQSLIACGPLTVLQRYTSALQYTSALSAIHYTVRDSATVHSTVQDNTVTKSSPPTSHAGLSQKSQCHLICQKADCRAEYSKKPLLSPTAPRPVH